MPILYFQGGYLESKVYMSKKNVSPANKLKADIEFEKEPWKSANELCGAVAENQYKDYVPPCFYY